MSVIKKLKPWLLEPCKDSEISTLNGALYLPIGVVMEKIWYMQNQIYATVHISHFSHQYFRLKNDDVCSGNIQLRVIKQDEGIDIILSGAATILLSQYPDNHHFAETVKSLAIVNACKGLGPQFGSHLNELVDLEAQKSVRQKPVADELIKAKYKNAIAENDQKTVQQLKDNYAGLK